MFAFPKEITIHIGKNTQAANLFSIHVVYDISALVFLYYNFAQHQQRYRLYHGSSVISFFSNSINIFANRLTKDVLLDPWLDHVMCFHINSI